MARPIDCEVIVPEAEDATHEGCAVLTKRRAVIIAKGQCGTMQWQMRWKDGQVADLSSCFPSNSLSDSESTSVAESDLSIKVRFQGCNRSRNLAESVATVYDAATGTIRFQIPSFVCQHAGLYTFQAAVLNGESVVFADDGLLSVEHGMWGDDSSMRGPPTIEEIRMHLRDRPQENDLLQAVEFDNAEILDAIRHPVMYWNEEPPELPPYNCNNFPFRHHWRNAIVAELLFTAAHHYVRNKMQAESSGLRVDDKAKDRDYLAIAGLYKAEWEQFVKMKKISINALGFYGTASSPYGS